MYWKPILFLKSPVKFTYAIEHGDTKTINSKIENSIIDAEITKSTGDETRKNEHKRKRKKDFIHDHVQQYYFYDHLLK